MKTYECISDLNGHVKARLDHCDTYDCYVDESGDIVLADGAEPFSDLSGLREVGG